MRTTRMPSSLAAVAEETVGGEERASSESGAWSECAASLAGERALVGVAFGVSAGGRPEAGRPASTSTPPNEMSMPSAKTRTCHTSYFSNSAKKRPPLKVEAVVEKICRAAEKGSGVGAE